MSVLFNGVSKNGSKSIDNILSNLKYGTNVYFYKFRNILINKTTYDINIQYNFKR